MPKWYERYPPTTKKIHRFIFSFTFPSARIKKELACCKTVIDLGCGSASPIHLSSKHFYSVGLDLHLPYIFESKKKGIHSDYVRGDVRTTPFKEKSFDAVLALDVIEHLTKEEGRNSIQIMEKLARKKVIVSTPNGFVPDHEIHGNIYEAHKSGWFPQEFKDLGYSIIGMRGLWFLRGEMTKPKFRPHILCSLISDVSQILTYYIPRKAFEMLCIKSLGED